MEHCAIDLGGRESQVCVRRADGHLLFEGRWPTASLPDYLRELPPSRVILETAAEAFRIADAAKQAHEVRVVPATLVRTLGVGARKTKTDKRDARVLSEVSCRIDLPSVHIPSARLVATRNARINRFRSRFIFSSSCRDAAVQPLPNREPVRHGYDG